MKYEARSLISTTCIYTHCQIFIFRVIKYNTSQSTHLKCKNFMPHTHYIGTGN